jgi:NEDD8-activating enzyme E1 regulatory subunit
MAKYGAVELHNISSITGGCGAQEMVKLCTKQRLPINNTFIFNGLKSKSLTFEA